MIRKIKDKVKSFLTRYSEVASDVPMKEVTRKRLIEKEC